MAVGGAVEGLLGEAVAVLVRLGKEEQSCNGFNALEQEANLSLPGG